MLGPFSEPNYAYDPPKVFGEKLEPPYTNRWKTKPGPNYRQCAAITNAHKQCRACAVKGQITCAQHKDQIK